jgi:hypothetical protein
MKCSTTGCTETEGLTTRSTYPLKNGTRGKTYICRFHNAEKKRKEIARNPSASRRAEKNWDKRNPEKVRAHSKARKIKLEPCEVCGDTKSLRHHPDYSKPLEVRFLCWLHHKQVHKGILCLK